MGMATDDPLGIGGLLCDALRITNLADPGRAGVCQPAGDRSWFSTCRPSFLYRIRIFQDPCPVPSRIPRAWPVNRACRDRNVAGPAGKNRHLYGNYDTLNQQVRAIHEYMPLREQIEGFWLEGKNREAGTWTEHREINMVMLATSLAPEGFLGI